MATELAPQTAAQELSALVALTQTMVAAQHRQDIAQAQMLGRLDDLTREQASLLKIMRDGNGQPSLLVRMALVEHNQSTLAADMREAKETLESRGSEDAKHKWQLMASVISGLLALASAIVTALLALNK